MSEDYGISREEELTGARPQGRTDEGSEWQREREGRTGSAKQRVVDVGKVDETGSARDEPEEGVPHEGA